MKEMMINLLVEMLNEASRFCAGYTVSYWAKGDWERYHRDECVAHTTTSFHEQSTSGKLLLDGHWVVMKNIESIQIKNDGDEGFEAFITMKSSAVYRINAKK